MSGNVRVFVAISQLWVSKAVFDRRKSVKRRLF